MTPLVEEIVASAGFHPLLRGARRPAVRLFLDSASTGSGSVGILSRRRSGGDRAQSRRGSRMSRSVDWHVASAIAGDALVALRQIMAPSRGRPVAGLPPFQGGAAGYVGYDWGLTLERLPSPRYDDLGLPDLVIALYDWVLAWDHESSRAWLISTGIPECRPMDAATAQPRAPPL